MLYASARYRSNLNYLVLYPAEKFREMLGEEASSKSGKFTFLNCFDMGSGSLACGAKEGVKLYVYNLRSSHVERVRQQAIEQALAEAISEGRSPADAAKLAQKVGAKSAKLASRQAKRILGPLISSGWDFFEAMYFGGSMTEGFLRGTGTLLGTYMGGFHGEQRVGGRIGYLMGSHIGSWIGARVGLMVYDVVNGVGYLVNFVQTEESNQSQSGYENEYKREESSEESQYYERPDEETQESEGFSLF